MAVDADAAASTKATSASTAARERGAVRLGYSDSPALKSVPDASDVLLVEPDPAEVSPRLPGPLQEKTSYTRDVPAAWGDSESARVMSIQTYVSVPITDADDAVIGTCAVSARTAPI